MSTRRLVGSNDIAGCPSGGGHAAALHWILRIGVAACFAALGASEMIAHRAQMPYFAPEENAEPWAWQLVPVPGALAMVVALLTLVRPVPALLLWAVVWGIQAGWLRLLSGDRVWESLERADALQIGLGLALVWLRPPGAEPGARDRTRAIEHRRRLRAILGLSPSGDGTAPRADCPHGEVLAVRATADPCPVPAIRALSVQDQTPTPVWVVGSGITVRRGGRTP